MLTRPYERKRQTKWQQTLLLHKFQTSAVHPGSAIVRGILYSCHKAILLLRVAISIRIIIVVVVIVVVVLHNILFSRVLLLLILNVNIVIINTFMVRLGLVIFTVMCMCLCAVVVVVVAIVENLHGNCGLTRILVEALLALRTMAGQGETEYFYGTMMKTQNTRINDNARQFSSWRDN